jgi:hypothetical protein
MPGTRLRRVSASLPFQQAVCRISTECGSVETQHTACQDGRLAPRRRSRRAAITAAAQPPDLVMVGVRTLKG